MSDDRVYLYQPDGTYWSCDLRDLRACLGLAMDHGWRPAVGDPSSMDWDCELQIGSDDATKLGKTLELAVTAHAGVANIARAATLLGSGWSSTRVRVLRDLIDFCRQGEFESVDDEFPTLATRDEILQHARELATDAIDLSYLMAVSGRDPLRRQQLTRI